MRESDFPLFYNATGMKTGFFETILGVFNEGGYFSRWARYATE